MRREVGLYSRSVQWAKIALPILAIGLFSSVFLVSESDVFEGTGIVFSDADLSALGDGVQIKSPRFSGVTDSGDKFLLTANYANPDSNKPSVVGLEQVATTLDLVSGENVDITAARGELNVPTQELSLSDGITIATSEGFRGKMESALARMREGILTSDDPVEVVGPMGQITAGSLEFKTVFASEGETVQNYTLSFREQVRVIFHPDPIQND